MQRSVAAALFAILLFALAGHLLAQNQAVGTWKLNVAKSKYNPGPAPQSMTRTVEAQGDNVKYTFEGVASDGSAVSYTLTVAFDGKDYPITVINGSAPGGADSISSKKLSSRSYEATFKKGGEPVFISRVEISADGKVKTITQTSPPGKGSVKNLIVYEKQ